MPAKQVEVLVTAMQMHRDSSPSCRQVVVSGADVSIGEMLRTVHG